MRHLGSLLLVLLPSVALAQRAMPSAVKDFVSSLPSLLLRVGPRGIHWWQWLAMPLVALIAWVIGRLLSALTRAILLRVVSQSRATWDDQLLQNLQKPITAAWAIAVFSFGTHFLWLTEEADASVARVLSAGLFVIFFWALLRAIDTVHSAITASTWAVTRPSSRALLPLMNRVAKVVVVGVSVVAVLSELGYPVASLIAGLGIGGLAVALAAQKTVENLFGAFSLGVDQPLREGDFVKVEDFTGTVEKIGLRSTRFRTADRTLISMPNGKLADLRIENFAHRDRLRLYTVLGLVYSTRPAQVRAILKRIEELLRAHPKIWKDNVVVKFSALGASTLDIEVVAWFVTSDWGEFQAIRQETLLQIMEIVEAEGSSFAFPTTTVHLVREPSSAA